MDFRELNIRHMSELDRLPWFDKDEAGQLRLADDAGVPPIIDIHSHVGWSYGLAKPIDYAARNELMYLYDYEVDQDVLFEERHPLPVDEVVLNREIRSALFKLGESSATHTAANFAAEMDRFNIERTCLLPIVPPIFSRHAEDTMRAATLDKRFIPLASVYPRPWGSKKIRTLEGFLNRGAKAVKFHPEFQFVAPDSPAALKLLEWCAENAVPVLAHCGYTGKEPARLRALAEPDRFRPALERFPKLQMLLAHTGLICQEKTLAVARDFADQVWLDISGQCVPDLKMILDNFDRTRICFGSDWPFYPLAVALGRALVATEDIPDCRPDLLHNNAERFLGLG